ncbi:hypothetical protein OBBRIDRAFT_144531 [Obba rivulosa]|uniref:Uncharacterized protein n=1 Tax=Obba rivulosa TaxID=1052685 RepID=A0A8E2DRE8_9APHY|nr:hypothetical protein OBBRIDRAFT_144531 [Obba rivulosa]
MVLPRKHIRKRQSDSDSPPAAPSIAGFAGASSVVGTPVSSGGLIVDTSAPAASVSIGPSLADTIPIITSSASVTPSPTSTPPPTSAASSQNSEISLSTVIGACLGAFAGLALLILLFVWLCKRSTQKAAAAGTQSRNAQGQAEQQRSRSQQNWNKLDDQDKWVGMPPPAGGESEKEQGMAETSFNMFKKSPSMRTTRTNKSFDEENTHDLPPFEFSKYHPHLAEELALEKPQRPYASRETSGISWDGDTVAEEPVLSLRSMRLDSGTMSPTMCMAKMTPPATSSPIHKWESAEVLNLEDDVTDAYEVPNPFADVVEEKRTTANPFFNAQELQRSNRLSRSRSTSTASRARSLTRSRSGTTSTAHSPTGSLVSPFADAEGVHEVPVMHVTPPTHKHVGSTSSSTGNAFGERAMRSFTAALNLTQEEVEERLRVVSMQGSTISGISSLASLDEESDIATVREFPLPPTSGH